MRLAWFRASSFTSVDALDATSAIIGLLRQTMTLDVISARHAHDFVVEQERHPYDLCVFEPGNHEASDFIWGYLFQYPGVIIIQDRTFHDSRVRAMEWNRREVEYATEFQFNHGHPIRAGGAFARGNWPMMRAPLLASRLAVVFDEERRATLQDLYPGVSFRLIPPCAHAPAPSDWPGGRAEGLRVQVVGSGQDALVARAVRRVRDLGVKIDLMTGGPLVADAEVVLALEAPADDASLTAALAAMSTGTAVVVNEREATAAWPAIDPQTWRTRDLLAGREPIVMSIDLRDQEHSLVLALAGLARDPALRRSLGAAAKGWWLAHGTPESALAAWTQVLEEARTCAAPNHPDAWPGHFLSDGKERARAVMAEFGLTSPI